jgi:ATP adenylyltransferase
MPDFANNLWAPWRMTYVESMEANPGACFLCEYRDAPERDDANHVLWRSPRTLVVFNRYPYTNGHLLVASTAHRAELGQLDDDEKLELLSRTTDAQAVLLRAIGPQGFNIGMNVGRCAGAGLPDHVHLHVVPRWNGDTNFMSVIGDARVILQAIDTLYRRLRELSAEMGLPRGRSGPPPRSEPRP